MILVNHKIADSLLNTIYIFPKHYLILNIKKEELIVSSSRDFNIVADTYFSTFYCSIIGGVGLNFSVRNGKR